MGRSLVNGFTTGSIMSRISLLAFTVLLCFIVVQAEDSQEHQLSNSIIDLSNLKRDVRSPDGNPKKTLKKRKGNGHGRNKKGQKGRRKQAKNSSHRSKKKSRSSKRQNSKSKKKSKSKPRKFKSGRKTKKNPKKVKIIKKKSNKGKNKPRICERQTGADDTTCLANIELAMDYEGKQIKNFKNQKKRVEDFDKLMKNKGGKKDNFQNTTTYMKDALGSDDSCNGTTNEADAADAVSTHATLSNCSTSVESGCAIPTTTYNSTELSSCETSLTAVATKNAECYKLTTATSPDLSAACTCWKAAAELVTETKALKCSAKSSYDTISALKKTCLSKFSDCKKAEDASVGLIQVGNGRTTPSTASVPSPAPAASTSTAAPGPTPTAAAEAASTASSSETTTAAGCKCGVKRTSRIVGGTETEANEYPWMAAIATTSESFFCGGTLISSQWVLTAAHCMFKDNAGTQAQTAGEIRIVLGEHDIGSSTESQIPRKVVQVSQITNHPSYDASSSNNDVALIKLSEEVDLDVYTPACLPKTADNYEGQKAWVYGWGTTSFGGSTSDKLLEVEVPVVSNTVCSSAMSAGVTDAMLCAGGELNKDGCQGDSGGPLTVDVNNQHVLIGDVSFGNGCGLAGQYGVYGDVAYFRSWIDTTVSGAKYCPA